jgi:hypothetical protein
MAEKTPYVLYLSSDASQSVLRDIAHKYPDGSIVSLATTGLIDLKYDLLVQEVNERGYAPAAIVSCPYYAANFLLKSKENHPCMNDFAGSLTLVGTLDIKCYQSDLPLLFERYPDYKLLDMDALVREENPRIALSEALDNIFKAALQKPDLSAAKEGDAASIGNQPPEAKRAQG